MGIQKEHPAWFDDEGSMVHKYFIIDPRFRQVDGVISDAHPGHIR